MQIAEKIIPENVAKNTFFGNIPEVILPKNEGQCRPLLEKLKHNGERIKVWCEVVGTGEKINAELCNLSHAQLCTGMNICRLYIETVSFI
jgi:hypothetical protein